MLEHYCRAALASFRCAPGAALVNVITLALGLACFTLAYAVVRFWDGADRHFANAERTYVVTSDNRLRGDGDVFRTGVVPSVNRWFAQYLRADYPQIEAVAAASV